MPDAEIIATLRNKYQALRPVMGEKVRRRWAACEAMAIGWGGITAVAEALASRVPPFELGSLKCKVVYPMPRRPIKQRRTESVVGVEGGAV